MGLVVKKLFPDDKNGLRMGLFYSRVIPQGFRTDYFIKSRDAVREIIAFQHSFP